MNIHFAGYLNFILKGKNIRILDITEIDSYFAQMYFNDIYHLF